MRIAIVSDIHGNLTAFEAVLADLRATTPDLIFHGGDLADAGSSPAEIVDLIQGLRWPGVIGNTDEMLASPESLTVFARETPVMQSLLPTLEEMAAATREALGEKRLIWLGRLPRLQKHETLALVHASPSTAWRAPQPEVPDADLEAVYAPLGRPIAVYGHIHRAFVRSTATCTIVNTGSVSLSYDGDPRASYLLVDEGKPSIRRVAYDVEREIAALSASRLPHADWVAKNLRTARPQMP